MVLLQNGQHLKAISPEARTSGPPSLGLKHTSSFFICLLMGVEGEVMLLV